MTLVNRNRSDLYHFHLLRDNLGADCRDSSVGLLVCQQTTLPVESLITNVTLKRLLVTVTVRVVEKSASSVKPFAADAADEGHLACMDNQVGL